MRISDWSSDVCSSDLGAKNVLMGGRLTLNAAAFFYDYSNDQVSQIRDRTAINENFDAKEWGAEFSAHFEPVDRLRNNANSGWMRSQTPQSEQSTVPMNRHPGTHNNTTIQPGVKT